MSGATDGEATGAAGAELQAGLAMDEIIDGRYRVVGRVGSGGMGEVVEVEHLKLGRTFALKALRPDLFRQRKVVQRFRTEWAAMAAIRSEHVVTIVDTGSLASGVPYFVMELLAGDDLRALLTRTARLPPVRVAELGIDACYGLSALHAAGLVHRDLKPENLFVTTGDDRRDVVKLLDLGVAKILGENATAPGSVIGTARYMAPEQVGEDGAVGPAADLFALGVILYEALAGRVPFDGDTFERVLFKIMTSEFEPLARACPEAPPALVDAVERALAKEPGKRHPSAAAFASALAQAVGSSRARSGARAPLGGSTVRAERRATTLDEAGAALDEPRTSTPPAHVASARAPHGPRRAGRALVAVAGLGAVLVVGALRLRSPVAEEAAPKARAAAPASPPPAPPAPPVLTPRLSADSPARALDAPPIVSVARPAASLPGRSPRRAPALASPARPADSVPRVAYDPENPYGK